MYGAAPRGDIKKRDLADDDIEGLCTIYPLGQIEPGNCAEFGRQEAPNITVSEVQGCQQVPIPTSWALLVIFFFLWRGYRKVRSHNQNVLQPFLLGALLALGNGCSERTTNTWEQNNQTDRSIQQTMPKAPVPIVDGGQKETKTAFFAAPDVVASPARGRLSVLRLEVAAPHPPLIQLEGTWGDDVVATMPWDKSKRLWQILFATPIGEKASQKDLALSGLLKNGQSVRFVKTFQISDVIYENETLKVPKKYIKLSRKNKKRVGNERALLKNLWTIDTTRRYWEGNFTRPSVNVNVPGTGSTVSITTNEKADTLVWIGMVRWEMTFSPLIMVG